MKTNKLLLVAALASVGVLASCGGNSVKAVGIQKAITNTYQIPFTVVEAEDGTKSIAIDSSKKQASAENIASKAANKSTVVLSKIELGDLYGMSSAPKGEWYVQASAFEAYAEGKTQAELKDKSYNSNHNPEGEITVEGCTITMEDYSNAFAEASDLYTTVDLKAGSYKLVSGSTVGYSTYAEVNEVAYLLDSSDKIVAAYFDVLQAYVTTNEEGKVVIDSSKTSSKNAGAKVVETKRELMDRYGMKDSAEKGEWYTQANAFQAYIVGKTVAECDKNYVSHYNPNGEVTIEGCSISTSGFVGALKGATKTVNVEIKEAGSYKLGLGTIVSPVDSSNVLNVTNGAVLTK